MSKSTHTARRCRGCGGLIAAKRKASTCSSRCAVAARSASGRDRMPKRPPGDRR